MLYKRGRAREIERVCVREMHIYRKERMRKSIQYKKKYVTTSGIE